MKSLLLAVLLASAPCAAESKCISLRYTVTGLVTDTSGAPVVNAQVTVSAPRAHGNASVRTDPDGRFAAELRFSPTDDEDSWLHPGAPHCRERLAVAAVDVATDGFVSASGEVRFDGLADTPREGFTKALTFTLHRAAADNMR